MSNFNELNDIRRLAGLTMHEVVPVQLNEAVTDDGDEDPDVKTAMSDKRQAEFERRNKSKIDKAQKTADLMDLRTVDAQVNKAAVEIKPDAPASDAPASTTRGRKPSGDSKSGKALAWLRDNRDASRGAFIKQAAASFGMTHHYANAFFYAAKRKLSTSPAITEAYMLQHGVYEGMFLGDNSRGWSDHSNSITAAVFESIEDAERVASEVADWYSMNVKVVAIQLV